MTLPPPERRLLLVTPAGWWRIPLHGPDARASSIQTLVRRQFRGVDDQPILRAQTEDHLAAAAQAAAERGGIEMYVSTDTVADVPIAASLVVSMLQLPGAGAAALASLAGELAGDGSEVTTMELPGCGPVVRRRRTALPAAAQDLGETGDSVLVDFYLPTPGRTGLALLNFATPLLPLAESMADLFEAIASTARWKRTRPADPAGSPHSKARHTAHRTGDGARWRIDLPPASWLQLPLGVPRQETSAWAHATAAEILPHDATTELVDALAADLTLQLDNAATCGAVLASVLIPEPHAGSLAVLLARPLEPLDLTRDANDTPAMLAAAQQLLTRPDGGTLVKPAETTHVQLPAGPACRARLLRAVPVPDEPDVLIESVVHVLAADQPRPRAAEIRLGWLAVALGDELAALADEIAAGFSW